MLYVCFLFQGAGHGLSGILQILLAIPECLDNNPQAESDVKASIDFLISLQTPAGNFPTALDELGRFTRPEGEELVHWCHGAPGKLIVLCQREAQRIFQKYNFIYSILLPCSSSCFFVC